VSYISSILFLDFNIFCCGTNGVVKVHTFLTVVRHTKIIFIYLCSFFRNLPFYYAIGISPFFLNLYSEKNLLNQIKLAAVVQYTPYSLKSLNLLVSQENLRNF
jgi:hypothetical protein